MSKYLKIIMLSFLLFGCGENEQPSQKEVTQTKNVENLVNNKEEDTNNIYKENSNIIIDENNNFTFYNKNRKTYIEFDKNNKDIFSVVFFNDGDILNLKLEKTNIVSSVSNDLSYLNIVNTLIIDEENYKLKYQLSNEKKELNINNSVEDFIYKNISNLSINKNNKSNFININLTNKNFCNENNSIITNKNNSNETEIFYNNSENNLICGKENIFLFKGDYRFEDRRDFTKFDKYFLSKEKESIFKEKISKNYPINIFYKKENIIIEVNDTKKENYSLNYKYDNKNKEMTLYIYNVPSNWTVVDKITLNKDIFYSIQNIDIKEKQLQSSKNKKLINEKNDFLVFYDYGEHYTYINNLSCDLFKDKVDLIINELDKPKIQFLKGSNQNCKTHSTIKIAVNINDMEIKNKKYYYSDVVNEYFNVSYENNEFLFKNKTKYNIYFYKILNNQLYLYIDKENKNYYIVNEPIKNIKIKNFTNINIVKDEHKDHYNYIFNKHNKIYRDYNEKMKANISFSKKEDYKYYNIRFHSIELDNYLKKCNNTPIFEKKLKNKTYLYYLKDNKNSENCNNIGVQNFVFKIIGNKVDVDFIDETNKNKANKLRVLHDKQQAISKNTIKNSFLDFDLEIIYVNSERYIVLKIKDLNKYSNLKHSIEGMEKKDSYFFFIEENEKFIHSNETVYHYFKLNKDINNFVFELKDINGKKKIFNYKLKG